MQHAAALCNHLHPANATTLRFLGFPNPSGNQQVVSSSLTAGSIGKFFVRQRLTAAATFVCPYGNPPTDPPAKRTG